MWNSCCKNAGIPVSFSSCRLSDASDRPARDAAGKETAAPSGLTTTSGCAVGDEGDVGAGDEAKTDPKAERIAEKLISYCCIKLRGDLGSG